MGEVERMEAKVKVKFRSIVMNWVRIHFENDDNDKFPLDIVELIVNIFLYEKVKFLSFSSTLKSAAIVLSDDNKCAHRMKGNGHNPYVAVDGDSAKSSILWRIKVH